MVSAVAVFAAWAVLVVAVAPAAQGAASVLDRYQQVRASLEACTARFGYDPKARPEPAPRRLAPGERGWRACAYESVRALILPHTAFPEAYRRLIADDQRMTALIERGRMTRRERGRRLDDMIRALEARELEHVMGTPPVAPDGATLKRREELELARRIFAEFRGTLAP